MTPSRKATLLVTCSAIVIAATATQGASAQTAEPKWRPWAEAEVQFGDGAPVGGFRGFAPIDQTSSSLLYLDGFIGGSDTTDVFGSFGVGARGILKDRLILGGSGFVNMARPENGDPFTSLTFGVEALTENLDFRVNYHRTLSDDNVLFETTASSLPGGSFFLEDNRLVERTGGLQVVERGYSGIEGEVGVRAPVEIAGAELRLFAGGFRFTNDLGPTVAGPRGRAEVRLYDFLGEDGFFGGARLTLAGEVTNDDVRGTEARGELRVRLPFGGAKSRANYRQRLTPLERRMTERVERDTEILRITTTVDTLSTRAAIDPVTNEEFGLFFFADGANTTGAGTQADRTTIDDAVARAGAGGVIVIEGDVGVATTGGVVLADGQTVVGGAATFPVLLDDGTTAVFSLSGVNGSVVGDSGAPVFTLGDDNRLQDLTITGGSVAVAGSNINNFVIENVSINSPAGLDLNLVTGVGSLLNSTITTTAGNRSVYRQLDARPDGLRSQYERRVHRRDRRRGHRYRSVDGGRDLRFSFLRWRRIRRQAAWRRWFVFRHRRRRYREYIR